MKKGSTEVLASCLASRPEKRLASAAELDDRLTSLKQNVDSNRQKAREGNDQGRPIENDQEPPRKEANPNTENNNQDNERNLGEIAGKVATLIKNSFQDSLSWLTNLVGNPPLGIIIFFGVIALALCLSLYSIISVLSIPRPK